MRSGILGHEDNTYVNNVKFVKVLDNFQFTHLK